MKKLNYFFLYFILIGMLALPILLFMLPKTYFDQGPTTCVYTLLTGVSCMGCGMTRACMRLIHFDIKGAWEFNKFSIIVFPSFAYYYGNYFFDTLRKIRLNLNPQ